MSAKQAIEDSGNFAYKYIKDRLTNILTQELIAYMSNTLTSSEFVLKDRSSTISSIKRDIFHASTSESRPENISLAELLEQYIESAQNQRIELESGLEDIKKRKEELVQKKIAYDSDDKKVEKITVEIYDLERQVERAQRIIPTLEEKKEVQYLIAPVKTGEYTALRIVLPVDAKEQIPDDSLIDYIYTAINAETTTSFQEEAFGDISLEYAIQLATTTLNGNSFHAIDIIYDFDDSSVDDILSHLSDFVSGLMNNPVEYFRAKGIEKEEDEIAQANITLKPLIFPFRYPLFIKGYMDGIKKEIRKTSDDFKKFIIDNFGSTLPAKVVDKIIGAPIESKLFADLAPYAKSLDDLCEKHRIPFLEKFYKDVLKTEFKPSHYMEDEKEQEDSSGTPQWIEKEKALKAFFPTLRDDLAEKTYNNAVSVGALVTRKEGEKELVQLDSILNLHECIIKAGYRIQGIYDEPVIKSADLARQFNLDVKKLNRLMRDGIVPCKEIRNTLYILRRTDTEQIIDIYHAND